MDAVEERVNTTETMSQFLTLNRIFGVLEMVRSRYRLLRAVTWRYVSSPCSGSVPLSCFYGGLLLDELRHILRFASAASGNIGFDRHYVYRISQLCTRFMNHFEEITEPQFNTDYSVSGSKIIDLLDCIMDDEEWTGPYQQAVTNRKTECNIKARYRLQRTWLICLGEREPKSECTWSEEQRHLYRCLRQLITVNNDFVMKQNLYKLERMFQDKAELVWPSSYTGFHKIAGQLILCGSMYLPTFVEHRRRQYADKDTLPLHKFIEQAPLDLHIDIEMKCPKELAPIVYLETYNLNNIESLCNHMDPALLQGSQSTFFFKMDMCGTDKSEYAVPFAVKFEIKSSDFSAQKRGLFLQRCVNAVRAFLFSPLLVIWTLLGLKTTSRCLGSRERTTS
ncbi:hypothetical protein B7P43_G13392 [Cryptotermes secundus]|uniref:Uncharacterized protein n=2 Tax=Cryptotermes secundus TaxID=105785 RepID=A0A2J7RKV1_9NEOP|nr:hypothetical protein B7P43_G13392 [Cryptotermes secundus]